MSRVGYYLLSQWGKDEVERRVRKEIQERGLRHKDDLWYELGIKRSTYYKVIGRKKLIEKDTIALILDPLGLDKEDRRFYAYEEASGESDAVEQEANPAYFLHNMEADKDVPVCFEPLTADDRHALNEVNWQHTRFGEVWKVWAEHEVALKLTLCEGDRKLVLGIVKLGTVQRINGGAGSLCDSLLEASPAHRFDAAGRSYRGIGSVLVARLVVESKAQGAEGRLRVRPAQGSIPFYQRLGFTPVLGTPFYVLEAKQAEELLAACTPSPM